MFDPKYTPSLPYTELKAKIDAHPASAEGLYNTMAEMVAKAGDDPHGQLVSEDFYLLIDTFMHVREGESYGEDMQDDTQAYITCLWIHAMGTARAKQLLRQDHRLAFIAKITDITINGL